MLILYNPPSSSTRKPVVPLSLLALGALLEGEHDYTIIDGNLEADPMAAIDAKVREEGAGVIGVTVMPGPQLNHAAPFCKELKSRHPALKIIWGGYFPSQHYEACLRSGYVDYIVRGCGELAFKQLVEALKKGDPHPDVPCLAYREPETGEIVSGNQAETPHPDELPDYPYHRIDMERYLRRTFMGQRTISHHSSYGCPFACDFCAVINVAGRRWRAQSAERLAGVVQMLKDRFNADSVEFFDNSFFIDESRTAEFCRRIEPLGIGWWAEARIDVLLNYSDATWELLERSGLKMVFMGAESGSDQTLQRMNKGGTATVENTLLIVEKMKRYGITPELSFVLGNPPDPEEDVRHTLAFVRKVKRINPGAEIILYMYTPVPQKGALYREAESIGFRFPETLEEWTSPEWKDFSQRRNINVPWLKDPLRRKVRNFECVLNAYYPTVTDSRLHGFIRFLLKMASAWRYGLQFYSFPLELRVLQKLLAYRRPETSGL
ncbi:MAG: B12-binding domain-containing radical SAM protein [Planctomycetota bacterium]|jgi:radical SAM superfamily enzyme YgiQ (UPF0313 family)